MNIICLSSANWDDPLWTNKQHVMSRLSRMGHRVLYVEPRACSYRRILGETLFRSPNGTGEWLITAGENLFLCPARVCLPLYFRVQFVQYRLQLRFDRWFLRRVAKRLGFDKPIVWIYHPEMADLLGTFDETFVVYDCVDEFSEFPQYAAPERRAWIVDMERTVLRHADIVFATSEALYESKKNENPNTYLVPNVADSEHFNRVMCGSLEVPVEIEGISRPRIGFVGTLDEYKVDFELLSFVAKMRPEWSLVLVGPLKPVDETTDTCGLRQMENVHFLGARPYADLPAYLKGCDVCIIPYRLNKYTESCFPMKFHEFLATGRPVVATNLSALREHSDVAHMARDKEEFVKYVERALHEDTDERRRARISRARANTWDSRIGQMLSLIDSRLNDQTGATGDGLEASLSNERPA